MRSRRLAAGVVVMLLLGCSSDSKPSATSTSTLSSASTPAPAPAPLRILVSNDDGVTAPGIDSLVQALLKEPDVEITVVAPVANQSGTGGKTTPGTLTAQAAATLSDYPATAVDGFPADAVTYALTVLGEDPDLVMSGTNAGQNIGPAVDLSGTVGAARAAAQRGIPAVAVSAGLADSIDFETATRLAIEWLREHRSGLPAATIVTNINAPTCLSGAVRGLAEVTTDATATLEQAIGPSDCTSTAAQPSTDVAAFVIGFATLTEVPATPANG